MERGVDTTISKQRGRFFTSKKRLLAMEETPSSIGRRRLFVFSLAVLDSEASPRYTPTDVPSVCKQHHSLPLSIRRGAGVRLSFAYDDSTQSRDRRPRLSA